MHRCPGSPACHPAFGRRLIRLSFCGSHPSAHHCRMKTRCSLWYLQCCNDLRIPACLRPCTLPSSRRVPKPQLTLRSRSKSSTKPTSLSSGLWSSSSLTSCPLLSRRPLRACVGPFCCYAPRVLARTTQTVYGSASWRRYWGRLPAHVYLRAPARRRAPETYEARSSKCKPSPRPSGLVSLSMTVSWMSAAPLLGRANDALDFGEVLVMRVDLQPNPHVWTSRLQLVELVVHHHRAGHKTVVLVRVLDQY